VIFTDVEQQTDLRPEARGALQLKARHFKQRKFNPSEPLEAKLTQGHSEISAAKHGTRGYIEYAV
jgi:hypothetical protein